MKKKVLLIYSDYHTFVKADYEILSGKCEVDRYQFQSFKRLFPFVYQYLKQIIFLLINGWEYDIFYIWFADYHSILPVIFAKLTNKRSFIVAGGFDATSIPQFGYGLFHKKNLRSFLGRKSFENCTKILPVDESLIENINSYAFEKPFETGIMKFCQVPKSHFVTIPTGYDAEFWKPKQGVERTESVVSVAGVSNFYRWKLKGGDLLVEIARLLPQYNFYFYGISEEFKDKLIQLGIPKNFHIEGFVSNESLPEIYSRHKVYAQFSLSEGLPNVLCEAMLCGCIPVGSNVNGIPNAIGESSLILRNRDIYEAKSIVLNALKLNALYSLRDRIAELYPNSKRMRLLDELL